jgi:hypothetical protein
VAALSVAIGHFVLDTGRSVEVHPELLGGVRALGMA